MKDNSVLPRLLVCGGLSFARFQQVQRGGVGGGAGDKYCESIEFVTEISNTIEGYFIS